MNLSYTVFRVENYFFNYVHYYMNMDFYLYLCKFGIGSKNQPRLSENDNVDICTLLEILNKKMKR